MLLENEVIKQAIDKAASQNTGIGRVLLFISSSTVQYPRSLLRNTDLPIVDGNPGPGYGVRAGGEVNPLYTCFTSKLQRNRRKSRQR